MAKTDTAPNATAVSGLLAGPLWLMFAGRELLNGKATQLLHCTRQQGSITKAAHAVPMSYKGAWDLIDRLNNLSGRPLVVASVGGREGGGASLTPYGEQILAMYETLERSYSQAALAVANVAPQMEQFLQSMAGVFMRTSARNQFSGTVEKLVRGLVNTQVVLRIAPDHTVTAVVTNENAEDLGLREGSTATALVKATAVILLGSEGQVRVSAENRLKGTVASLHKGMVNTEVIIELGGGKTLAAVVTNDTVSELGLREGGTVLAVFGAFQVILVVNA